MPDYSKGKIYTIRCHTDDSLIYVGSTTVELYKRLYNHKLDSKKYSDRLIYTTIGDDWDNWYIELYESYPCECKEQLNRREGELIREIGTLNKNIAGRTSSEYYVDNQEQIAEQQKQYYQANREQKVEQHKQYRQANREQIAEYKKQYYQANREQIAEYHKQYSQANREQIAEYHKQYNQANRKQIAEHKKQYYQAIKNKKLVQSILNDIIDDIVYKSESKNSELDDNNL